MQSSPSFHADTTLSFAAIFAGACLLFAAGVVVSVLFSRRGEGIQWGKIAVAGFSLLWLVPIIGALMLVSFWVVGRTQGSVALQQEQEAKLNAQMAEARLQFEQSTEIAVPSDGAKSDAEPKSPTSAPATVSQPLPDWVNEKQILSEDKKLLVLSSRQYALVEEADAEIRAEAQNWIRQDMRLHLHYEGLAPVPPQEVEKALCRRHVEEITRHSGANTFRVYRVYRQLELSPALRKTLEPMWREQNGKQRLWGLASLAGFATLIVATMGGYLRLDTRTGSAFRGRLKFAAVCLIVAGGVAAMGLIIA